MVRLMSGDYVAIRKVADAGLTDAASRVRALIDPPLPPPADGPLPGTYDGEPLDDDGGPTAGSATTTPPGDDLRSALPGRDGTPRLDTSLANVRVDLKSLERGEAPPVPSPPEDVRTLTVQWDEHGERYKS